MAQVGQLRSLPAALPAGSARCRRALRVRSLRVRAAAPPASPPATSVTPLTRQDLVQHLRSGCKPRDKWRIGTEHEKFGFRKADKRPIDYSEVKHLLLGLVNRFGWEPIVENEFIIGCKLDGQSVTLEPGGQFELSGAPVETLHMTCAEVNSHLYQVKTLADEIGIAFLGLGFQPKWSVADTPAMPKGRYKIMREYMPKVGTMGLDMMFRTCTVQVNLDFSSEEDMVKKFRVGLALQPIATALFANSPFVDGKPCGFTSFRSNVWTDVDKARTGDLPFVFEPGFGFEQYVDYVLDVPMYFVYRDGNYIDASGQSFRDFMEGRLPAYPGHRPSMDDWESHLTTVFPEVRLKRFLEMRGADNGPWRSICSLPALWVGLLYDQEALDEAAALVADWTTEERAALRSQVPRMAMAAPFRGGTVKDLSQRVVAIAKAGLQRRGLNEAPFLRNLEAIADSGQTAADVMLAAYDTRWGKSVDPAYDEYVF